MQFKRPERPQDKLGLDVELSTTPLENDSWAQTTLKDIGKAMKPNDMTYLGSLAVHYYRTSDNVIHQRYEMATKQQLAIGSTNEALVLMGLSNLAIELKKFFGHKHSTRDTKDRRGIE